MTAAELEQLVEFEKLSSHHSDDSDPPDILYGRLRMQILLQALIHTATRQPYDHRGRKRFVEEQIQLTERLTASSLAMPWTAGYSLFQAAMLLTMSVGMSSRAQLLAEGQSFIASLERINSILRPLQRKFKGLASHVDLLQCIGNILTSPSRPHKIQLAFLERSASYDFCNSAIEKLLNT